ncbi:(2Fe-2S)-binding domain protein (fragment) [Treponema phagedenis]|uniref:(2Fe-2S)-binding domain protein n=1 Tax=Treponema phagedenis TaxID=162 RepID=A0A0B7GV37_TREPH
MQVTIAYAENAAQNGVEFFLNTAATGMIKNGNAISQIITNRGTCNASLVINAAGVWADVVAGFAGDRFFSIHGRKGTDAILDKRLNGAQKTSAAMPDLLKLRKGHSKGGCSQIVQPITESDVFSGGAK